MPLSFPGCTATWATRGHRHLIEAALAQSKEATVIVCGKPSDPIPGELRRDWLQEMFPAAQVLLIDDRYDENDSRVWAENTIRWLGCAPDAVFTSEAYGDPYAEHLGCEHVCVDRTRATVPCSATQIRRDPYAWWSFIDAPVRGWYAKRVCVLGAESTGTTTLAAALAESYRTSWVAEFGRDYSACKQARGGGRASLSRSPQSNAAAKRPPRGRPIGFSSAIRMPWRLASGIDATWEAIKPKSGV